MGAGTCTSRGSPVVRWLARTRAARGWFRAEVQQCRRGPLDPAVWYVRQRVGGRLAVDGSGDVYVSGYTYGALDGANAGSRTLSCGSTAVLARSSGPSSLARHRTTSGSPWQSMRLGTSTLPGTLKARSLARTRATMMFSCGSTVVLARSSGPSSSARHRDDEGFGVAVDGSGDAYVAGYTVRRAGWRERG